MITILKPPTKQLLLKPKKGYVDPFAVFLAGTIDLGNSVDWQADIGEKLTKLYGERDAYNIIVYNPRRDNWDPTWKQSLEEPRFVEQVNWEIDGMDSSNLVAMNIIRDSISIISMMELGLYAKEEPMMYNMDKRAGFEKRGWRNAKSLISVHDWPKKIMVHCPDGYHRKGNVDVVCQRFGILQADSEEQFFEMIVAHIEEFYYKRPEGSNGSDELPVRMVDTSSRQ